MYLIWYPRVNPKKPAAATLKRAKQPLSRPDRISAQHEITNQFRARVGNRCKVYFVVPDYYATRPKACMNGWGSVFLNIAADGLALPCHEARMLPGLIFPNVREHDVRWIWHASPGFNAYRGDDWMQEPCRSCPEKTKDFGGCRCQAYLLTGSETPQAETTAVS